MEGRDGLSPHRKSVGGFSYPEIKTALITQTRAMRAGSVRKKKHKRGEEIRTLSDITPGDLVVHALHGIGRFLGIRKLELEGVTKDYITIQYAGKENLYVPVTQLDMVSKYIGPREDTNVKLSRLSSPEWQKRGTTSGVPCRIWRMSCWRCMPNRKRRRALHSCRMMPYSMSLKPGFPMWRRKTSWRVPRKSSRTWNGSARWIVCSAAMWALGKQRLRCVRR